MSTPIINDFEQMEAERGYGGTKPPTNNSGFMPLDQALASLNKAPAPTEAAPGSISAKAPTIKPIEAQIPGANSAEIEQTIKSIQEMLNQAAKSQRETTIVAEQKIFIGGIDHLEFKKQEVSETTPEVEEKHEDHLEPSEHSEHTVHSEHTAHEAHGTHHSLSHELKEVAEEWIIEPMKELGEKAVEGIVEVGEAVFELREYIFFHGHKEKSAKQKEDEKKQAERNANKRSFFQRLKESMSQYQSEKMKKRMENRKRLNIIGLAAEQINSLLGEKRNSSFEAVDADYYDEQTAIGMFYKREMEKRAKAEEATKTPGKSLTDEFSQARFAGERGAGHNAQSATG